MFSHRRATTEIICKISYHAVLRSKTRLQIQFDVLCFIHGKFVFTKDKTPFMLK